MIDNFKDDLPMGLGFSMAMNEKAMCNFAHLSEDEKRQVIEQSRQVKSKAEMAQIVDRLAENFQ